MPVNPETLLEDTAEQRAEREVRTGSIGNGLEVWCQPYLDDREIYHKKNRVVCLAQPYQACQTCHHKLFTLYFNSARKEKVAAPIACPRWANSASREKGFDPDHYTFVTQGTCTDDKPFTFCSACPKPEQLVQIGLDKSTQGWYGRYQRFRKEGLLNG